MAALFRIILFLLLAYYLVKIFSFLFRSPNTNKRPGEDNYQRSSRKEGEVSIDHVPDKDETINKDKGDYVDYEELE